MKLKIEINFDDEIARVGLYNLQFNGNTRLFAHKAEVEPKKIILDKIEFDGDVRELIYGELIGFPIFFPDIKSMTLITDKGETYPFAESAFAAYQHMEFAGKTITKKEYLEIAREVHKNDRKDRFLNIIENMDGYDDEQDEALDYLKNNPAEEFIEFVDDKLDERITGEDEIAVIEELIENYKDTILGNRQEFLAVTLV